ncbi:MAG: hypothetical protein CL681_01660 [Blastopirellula sp.]|nr:hypothetical protein [Blastopirellula sp.]MAR08665.1 hypothetical protein [Blastopirellula sp.]|tara:strand:- start:892 stop:1155 length:264 start_codon:yes stop_codon:yes gene_type:complete
MHLSIDPLLMLPLLAVIFIVSTLPDDNTTATTSGTAPVQPEPFQLDDGNVYVKHAGMTIEREHNHRCRTAQVLPPLGINRLEAWNKS